MATILIRNASLFSPDPLGTNDILIINDRIAAIAQNISIPEWLGPVQEMDGKGLFAVPGFIDAHVHITGGGGVFFSGPSSSAFKAYPLGCDDCRWPSRHGRCNPAC